MIGRLKPSWTIERASAQLDAVSAVVFRRISSARGMLHAVAGLLDSQDVLNVARQLG